MKLIKLQTRYFRKEESEQEELLGISLEKDYIDADIIKPLYTISNIRPFLSEEGIIDSVTVVDFNDLSVKLDMPIVTFLSYYAEFASKDNEDLYWDLREECMFDEV
jgi:hypothetical protein